MLSSVRWSTFAFVACGVVAVGVESRAHAQATPPADTAAPPPAEAAPPPPAEAPPPPPPPPPIADMAPPPPPPPPAKAGPPAFKIEIPKTETVPASSIKIGLLFQPQFQTQQAPYGSATSTLSGWKNDLYVRRTRILLGGTLFGMFDYFIDTDYANLGLSTPGSTSVTDPATMMTTTTPNNYKGASGLNIQDAFITFKPMGDLVKVDAGYMLPPLAHNAVQGATTLYSWDYFANSFRFTNLNFGFAPTAAAAGRDPGYQPNSGPVGRDTGLQVRGLIANMVEYRLGLFQGIREVVSATDVASRNFFRAAGRVQVNLMDPETGFFYAGTYHGSKKILSIGGTFDIQDKYKYFGGDVFVDMPLADNVITAQVNVFQVHGEAGGYTPTVAKTTAVSAEAGFLIGQVHLSPIVRFERAFVEGDNNDDTYFGGGLAWWPYNHNSNLKLFATNHKFQAASKSGTQVNLQWQLFFF
jgi:hypothetical protein